ncbi:MAG: ABC transporter ATP-binding protein [Lachnospiraceae bacterium]
MSEEKKNIKSIVSIEHVEKWYGNNHVVKDMNIEIAEGEFLTLLGPSGCGKTTTLRMISGFEKPTKGSVKVQGENVEKKEPYQRDVNTVFQNYALFPNMNVYDNVAYGLVAKKVPKAEIKQRVEEMLHLVQLEGFGKRKITQMSGGQKQRVAIARALINRPKVLLLDEPLGALDLKLRKQMQIELKRLQKQLKITFVYVTHDQEEALTMSDRIAVINGGVLEQIDTPKEIYEHPKTKFVAGFIGESNIFDGVVHKENGVVKVGTEVGNAVIEDGSYKDGDFIAVSVRPENVRFSEQKVNGFSIAGVVKEKIYVGNLIKMIVQLRNGEEVKITRQQADEFPEVGTTVYLSWPIEKGIVICQEQAVVQENIEMIQELQK